MRVIVQGCAIVQELGQGSEQQPAAHAATLKELCLLRFLC
jgi:hypothetical protein